MIRWFETRVVLPAVMLGFRRRKEGRRSSFDLSRFNEDVGAVPSSHPVPPDLPRRIFILWHQGFETAPPLVQLALRSWRDLNPGWEVVALSRDAAASWADLGDIHPALPIATWSDALRLRLLDKHGGVWVDATTVCMRPLDDWLGAHMNQGFFAFANPSPTRSLASWFLASQPGSPLVAAWRRTFDGFIRGRQRPIAYFCVHHTFDYLLRTRPSVRRGWAAVLPLSADGPHMLKWLVTKPSGEVIRPAPSDLAVVPLFKLDWRLGRESIEAAEAAMHVLGMRLPGLQPPVTSPA